MCDKQDSVLQCSQNLDTEMCVTLKKSFLKSKEFLKGMFMLFYVRSMNVSFIIYSVQNNKIACLYDNINSGCMKCSLHIIKV
jgi:hypothetical protein